jgi:hypothetical protein
MERDANKQNIRHMMEFLGDKWRSPGVSDEMIVSRYEIEQFAQSIGMDKEEAWRMFGELKGHAWEGWYMQEIRSEERGYLAARLTWVYLRN